MECAKFEEFGLLYVSGELSADEVREYEAHLEGCDYCKSEVSQYKEESASIFTEEMLSEEPSAAVDAEILRVCSDPKKMWQPAFIMPMMFLKKYAPIPVFLMLVIVAIGGYVRYHSMTAEDLRIKYSAPVSGTSENVDDIANPIDYSNVAVTDSGAADISDSALRQSRPMGKVGVPVSENHGN